MRGNSLDLIRRAEEFIRSQGRPEPLGGIRQGFEPLPEQERKRRAAAMAPVLRGWPPPSGTWSATGSSEPVLDFLARDAAPRVVPLGTSCPDHFLRTKVRPLLLDLPTDVPLDDLIARLRELHRESGRVPCLLPAARRRRDLRRCGAQTPPSSWFPESACSASAATQPDRPRRR